MSKRPVQTVNLEICDLYPHPNNPRKDLGDITELTESIKKNGIMQNMTVIPGHFVNGEMVKGGYTLIIGHRRCAAAKAAGLVKVPCRIIEDMDDKEQLSIMLEENMQRNDLTIWEQANGFQMMLDFGETEESIAQKTGFSTKTVKRRVEIAKLDQKLLKEKETDESFQLSIMDLYELNRIKDIATRNRILKESRNSRDLFWRAKQAVTIEKVNANYQKLEKILKEKGISKAPKSVENEQWSGKWSKHATWDLKSDIKDEDITWKTTGMTLTYVRWYNDVHLIYPSPSAKAKNKTAAEKKLDQINKNRKAISGCMKELKKRSQIFVYGIISGEIKPIKEIEQLTGNLWSLIVESSIYVSLHHLTDLILGAMAYSNPNFNDRQQAADMIDQDNSGALPMWKQMLLIIQDNISTDFTNWQGVYEKNDCVTAFYELLMIFGFSLNEDEEKIINGTHELYTKKDS